MTVTEFLLARYDEHERVLTGVEELRRYHDQQWLDGYAERHAKWPDQYPETPPESPDDEPDWYDNDEYDHLCLKPAHARADLAAKRAIVALHGPSVGAPSSCRSCGWPGEYDIDLPCDTLRSLVQPYAGHPDFDPSWLLDTPTDQAGA